MVLCGTVEKRGRRRSVGEADLQKMSQTDVPLKRSTHGSLTVYYGAHLTANSVVAFLGTEFRWGGGSANTNVAFTGQGDGSGPA